MKKYKKKPIVVEAERVVENWNNSSSIANMCWVKTLGGWMSNTNVWIITGVVKGLWLVFIVFLFVGCFAHYTVKYEDIQSDGSTTILELSETVGPGGKAVLAGNASAIVDASGAWEVRAGAESSTDMTEAKIQGEILLKVLSVVLAAKGLGVGE